MDSLVFKSPSDKEFAEVCALIEEYQLDSRNLNKNEFTIALQNQKLVGFGRLHAHTDCFELCSIGVLKTVRNKGIGAALVNNSIKQSAEPIYVVCIIPDFFSRFGFKLTGQYPLSIKNKMNYCTQQLAVPETYVVMVRG